MNLGVGLRLGGVIAASALVLAVTAGEAGMRDAKAKVPKIRKCDDRYCRGTESTLFMQDATFADGIRHFARAFEVIGRDRLDACRIQNPGYWTDIYLSIRPQLSTRTWIVETRARSIDPRAPANEDVARCFQQLFQQYLTSDIVSPEAVDAWRGSDFYFKTR